MAEVEVVVQVLLVLAHVEGSLYVDIGIPCAALADAHGALRDGQAVTPLVESRVEGAVAAGIVVTGLGVEVAGLR